MKKFFLMFLFFCLNVTLSNAQLLQYFTAKEGYQSALDEASNSLVEPKLFFIGTTFMNNPFLGQLKYDFKTGKANFWTYGFVDNLDTTKKVVVGTFKMFAFMSQAFPPDDIDPEDFPYLPEHYFSDLTWIDSDTANTYFKQCPQYLDYANSGQEPASLNLGLFYNTMFEELPPNIPLWSAFIELQNNAGFISPSVNLNNFEVYCNYFFTSIKNYLENIDQIKLNLSNNLLEISANEPLTNTEISIYTIDGKLIFNHTLNSVQNREFLYIPVLNIGNGTYMIVAKSRKGFGILKTNITN